MDFINWWFDQHYIVSTLLTPVMSLAWCFYQELIFRGIISGILSGILVLGLVSSISTAHSHY
jgi:hypothetical protein